MKKNYIVPTPESGAAFASRRIDGQVVMLNLLKFRDTADYSENPAIAPNEPITGSEAYQTYMMKVRPLLEKHGGSLVFLGHGGRYLIGPDDEHWDMMLLVRYPTVVSFVSFTTSPEYLEIAGHRTAAVEDSRLLPVEPHS
jgi:uncharacterized protein (DUF1330 family)